MLTQNELQIFQSQIKNLIDGLQFDVITNNVTSLQNELNSPEIWTEPHKVTKLNRELKKLTTQLNEITGLQNVSENLEVAFELNEEKEIDRLYNDASKQFQLLQNRSFLNGRFDEYDALLSIHAGAGGVDAQDFAAMLTSMYQAFCKKQGWVCQLIALSSGEEGGVKSVTLKIEGEHVYGFLKEEAGVQRLVRISPFNSGKTRETSFALVEVLPDGLDDEIELDEIPEKDLKWEYSMSSGKGGQSVNTTYSAVRVVHLPTGLSATCQNERNQTQNKAEALSYLRSKLAALELRKQKDLVNELKGEPLSAEWGSQIRSYVLHPYKLVKDHRSGWESPDPLKLLEEGDLLPIIWSVKQKK